MGPAYPKSGPMHVFITLNEIAVMLIRDNCTVYNLEDISEWKNEIILAWGGQPDPPFREVLTIDGLPRPVGLHILSPPQNGDFLIRCQVKDHSIQL